jgi:predicted phage terminase large subunit-like protein
MFRGRPGKFPACSFVMASIDSAYTEKERNDPTACTVWGIFRHPETNESGVMLMDAWAKHLRIRGTNMPQLSGESDIEHRERCAHQWGLVEWTWHTCRRFKVDLLLIESKASGITLAQELELEHEHELWMTELVTPAGDKESRAHSVVASFAQGLVWAPVRDWSKEVIDQCAKFPFATHDDLVDSTTMALRRLRDMGLLKYENERAAEEREEMRHRPVQGALYPV